MPPHPRPEHAPCGSGFRSAWLFWTSQRDHHHGSLSGADRAHGHGHGHGPHGAGHHQHRPHHGMTNGPDLSIGVVILVGCLVLALSMLVAVITFRVREAWQARYERLEQEEEESEETNAEREILPPYVASHHHEAPPTEEKGEAPPVYVAELESVMAKDEKAEL